jgi:hypothetical protein
MSHEKMFRVSNHNKSFSCGHGGSHHIIAYSNDTNGAIQYSHHIAINELDLKSLPGDQGPAAKFLSGIIPDARHELELQQVIADLSPLRLNLGCKTILYLITYPMMYCATSLVWSQPKIRNMNVSN